MPADPTLIRALLPLMPDVIRLIRDASRGRIPDHEIEPRWAEIHAKFEEASADLDRAIDEARERERLEDALQNNDQH